MFVIGILGRIAAGLVLLGAAGMAVLMGMADVYAQRSTTEGLARAVELRPGNADYHRWLGITLLLKDRKRAEGEFREAVRLNAWDADSRMRLALMHEAEGKVAEAERELEEAAKVDATFLPRWALANFELRHERTPEFWKWARAAVPMSYGDRSPLFDLAAATGETNLGERLGLEKDEVWASYLGWAMGKAPAGEIREAAMHVARGRHPEGGALTQACDRLLDLGWVEAALEVWNAGVKAGVMPAGEAVRGKVTNPGFGVDPGGWAFDWVVSKPERGFVARENQQGGLRIHFTGDQCEQCAVLTQRIAVSPGAEYRVRATYRTIEMKRKSGLSWAVSSAKSQLAISEDSLWADEGGTAELSFRAPDGVEWVRLALLYQRPQGEVRTEGTLLVERVEMDAVSRR